MTIVKYCTTVRDALIELAESGRTDVLRDGMVAAAAVSMALAGQVYPAVNLAAPLACKYHLGDRFARRRPE